MTERLPLPEPWRARVFDGMASVYTAEQMHAYSDFENAQFKVLNNALVAANTDLNNALMAEALSAEGLADAQAMLMTENKALRESVRVLREALEKAVAELDELPTWSNTGHVCNLAHAALEATK